MKPNGLSIKFKLILFSLCISLIPIVIITTVYFFNARNTIKKQTLAWLTAIAESRKAHLITSLEAEKSRTEDFASDGFIRDSLEAIKHKEAFWEGLVVSLNNHLLHNKKPLDPHIIAISIATMDGKVIASTDEALIGKDISDQDIFLQAISKDQDGAYIGQPLYGSPSKTNCLPTSALITCKGGAGNAMGVIINDYTLDALSKITTNRAGMGETGEVYLVNRDKIMLTESRFMKGAPLRQVVDTEPIRKIAREGKEMTGIYPDYRGVPIVGASAYIPEYGWTLLAEIDKAEAFAPIRTLGIIAMIIGVISAAAVTVVGIIFALSAARQIRKLIVATDKFKDGDLKFRAKIARGDEIGLLACSFNDMANELENAITEQKRTERKLRMFNESLELCVAERTAELTETNELLQVEIAERKRMAGQIETSLKEKEVLLREIHHRVKNNMQVIISMLMLQSGRVKADNIDDILKDSQSRIKAMALVHEKLYQTKDLANVNFHEYTKHLTNDIFRSFGGSVCYIELKIDVENIDLDIDTAILCGLIMNELISNSLKYAFLSPSTGAADSSNGNGSRGEITITMRRRVDSKSEIEWIIGDNGIGMPEELDFRNTKTLGLHLVNILVKQLEGELNLNRGKGTEFQIKFNVPQ
ncbi:MAG: sensor histidine kinase [Candidatus Brocadiales bacterium]